MATSTHDQLLDAAESLFADQGIDGSSLRSITQAAGVNLAAIHYHFGSKEALVKAVFERRIGEVNRQRLAMLDAFEAKAGGGQLAVEDVCRALVEPPMRLTQSCEQGRRFMVLCAKIYTESHDYIKEMFQEIFHEIVLRFGAAFRRALPDLPEVDLGWRMQFLVGAMVHLMREGERIRTFSMGMCDPSDIDHTIEQLVHFAAAGLRAPATKPTQAKTAEAVTGVNGGSR